MGRHAPTPDTPSSTSRSRSRCLTLLSTLALCWAVCAPVVAEDYLTPELRLRVEGLKAEVASEPTTAATFRIRADTLWRWANAYALAGGVIPNDLPLLVRASRSAGDPDLGDDVAPYLPYLDHFVRELALKDEVPGALGTLELDRSDPLAAEEWVTITQTWTVGEEPMVAGGAIAIGRDGFNNHGTPQSGNPSGNHYLTVTASRPHARFVYAGTGDWQTLVTSILGIFRLEGETLIEGDRVTLVYGDRSGGSRGFKVQSSSVSRCTFPVYLDLDGGGGFMQPAWPGVEVVGKREVSAVTAFAPSIVAPDEPFALTVLSEDDRYNRASGPTPAYTVTVDGAPVAQIPPGAGALTVVEGIRIGEPGVYRFTVRTADETTTGTSNPVWVRVDPPHRILWGDTHGHIAFADGQGTPDGYLRFARDDARLDFVTLSEHGLWLDDAEWRTLCEKALEFREDDRFVPIPGYEWTVALPEGHHNVYFRDPWAARVGSQTAWLLHDLYRVLWRRVHADDVLVIPHAHNPGNWTVSDPDMERMVEITSGHGTFEWFGNRYLAEGWQVGFVGSSDNHQEHPGYTNTGTTFHTQKGGLAAVLANRARADDIFDALRARRAYATGGRRIIVDATLNGELMGARLGFTDQRRISCRVMGTAPIEAVDVVRNGEVVYRRSYIAHEPASHLWVRLGFESSSEVFSYDRPRNLRVWKGTVEVESARLRQVIAPALENRFYEYAELADENLVEFQVLTRGRLDGVALELEDVGADAALRVRVEPGVSGHPDVETEAIDTTLRLADAQGGRLVREYEIVDPATGQAGIDAIALQIFSLTDSLDQEFEYTDLGQAQPGDYYYLRVTQIDGERAWSSPWWVGGAQPSLRTRPSGRRVGP